MSDPSDDSADEEPGEHGSDSPDGPEVKSKKNISRTRLAGILSPFFLIVALGLDPRPLAVTFYLIHLVSILSVLVDVRGVRVERTRWIGYLTMAVLVLSVCAITLIILIQLIEFAALYIPLFGLVILMPMWYVLVRTGNKPKRSGSPVEGSE
jgi:hypothetical protein